MIDYLDNAKYPTLARPDERVDAAASMSTRLFFLRTTYHDVVKIFNKMFFSFAFTTITVTVSRDKLNQSSGSK